MKLADPERSKTRQALQLFAVSALGGIRPNKSRAMRAKTDTIFWVKIGHPFLPQILMDSWLEVENDQFPGG
jgi:hypothetical protein